MWLMEQDPDKKEASKKEQVDDNIEFYFSRFEKHLKNNNGHFGRKVRATILAFAKCMTAMTIIT